MKKIVLGCAAALLSLGLLAGCNDNPSTVDAVIINVDSSASVIIGETLELPYSVEPEKATVVAASDHEEYVTADAQDGILYLHGVTEGSAIVTLVGTYKKYAEANVNINVSVVTEGEVDQEPGVPDTGGDGDNDPGTSQPGESALIGSFDFSSNEATNSGISTTDGLDDFWVGEELYLGARQHSSVYLGSDGGAFSGETDCIKLGTTTAGGLLQLKFELGTCVSKVVVTAHSWNADVVDDDGNVTSAATAGELTVNGVTEKCSTSGEPEAITYTITDDLTYLVTIESNVGLTVHGIEIYGTYEPEKVEAITSLSLSADANELEIGDTAEISVSWEPATTVFDIDELVWTSSDSDAVSVNSTPNGAEVHALDATDETTITATATNGVYATCGIKVNALEEEGLYGIYNFSKLTYSYTEAQTSGTSTHHLTTSELETQLSTAWTGASGNANPVTSVTDTSRIDDYNPTTSGWVQEKASLGYLKTGSSSAVGYMSLSLSVEVVKVVVNCHSWTTGTANQMVSVVDGGEEQVSSTSGTATDLTFEISSTDSLKIQGNYRVFIASIALYTE